MTEAEAEARLQDPRPIEEMELDDILAVAFGYSWGKDEAGREYYYHETFGPRAGIFTLPAHFDRRTLTDAQRYIVCRMIEGVKLARKLVEG